MLQFFLLKVSRESLQSHAKECPFNSASEQCGPSSNNSLCGSAVSKFGYGFVTAAGDVLSAPSRESLSHARQFFKEYDFIRGNVLKFC